MQVNTVLGMREAVEYNGRIVIKRTQSERLAADMIARGVKAEIMERLLAGDCDLRDGTRKAARIVAIAYSMGEHKDATNRAREAALTEKGIHFVSMVGRYSMGDLIGIAAATYYRIKRREYNNGRKSDALAVIEYLEDQLAGKRTTKVDGVLLAHNYSVRNTLRALESERTDRPTTVTAKEYRAMVLLNTAYIAEEYRESRNETASDHAIAQEYAVEELMRLRRAMGDRLTAKLDGIFARASAKYSNVDSFIEHNKNKVTMLFKNIRRKYGASHLVGASYLDFIAIFFNNWEEARDRSAEKEVYSYTIAS